MKRDLKEVLSSQKKMLGRLGKGDDNIPGDKMAKTYEEHLKQVKGWLVRQGNVEVLYVDYNTMVADPLEALQRVNTLLGGDMDIQKMASIVDHELYRERKQVLA